jgi:hypothetical protein
MSWARQEGAARETSENENKHPAPTLIGNRKKNRMWKRE